MQKSKLRPIVISILEDQELYQDGQGVYFIDIIDRLRKYSVLKDNMSRKEYLKILRMVKEIIQDLEDKDQLEERFFSDEENRGRVAYDKR